jgi:phosphatidylglycerophosphatase C
LLDNENIERTSVVTSIRPVVAAFDFDVTITTRDTFIPFLFYIFGWRKVFWNFVYLSFAGFLVLLGVSSRDKFKERIIESFFINEPVEDLKGGGLNYSKKILALVRPAAKKRIAWHKERGHYLVMVSASLDLYLKPIAKELGFDELLCTRLSHNEITFDGKLNGQNCRCQEKVDRLRGSLGELSNFTIYGYGDSAGDKELLAASDKKFWRPFEPHGVFFLSTTYIEK